MRRRLIVAAAGLVALTGAALGVLSLDGSGAAAPRPPAAPAASTVTTPTTQPPLPPSLLGHPPPPPTSVGSGSAAHP